MTPENKKRLRVGILFGGRSGEHEVSLASAASVIRGLDPDKYEAVPIGITKEGHWVQRRTSPETGRGGRKRTRPNTKLYPSASPKKATGYSFVFVRVQAADDGSGPGQIRSCTHRHHQRRPLARRQRCAKDAP